MIEPVECCRCHCAPNIVTACGLWYAYCPKCYGGNIYSICGLSKDKVIVQWNDINEHRKLFQPEKEPRKKKPADKTDVDLSAKETPRKPSYIGIDKLKGEIL